MLESRVLDTAVRQIGVFALAAALAAPGCGATNDDTAALPPPTPGTQVYPYEDTATSIEFLDVGDELTLVAGTPREVRVRVQPPGAHIVRFALLRAEDAFLSTDVKVTEADGIGSTTLTSLTASPGFSLLAMVGRLPQALRVVALEANIGNLLLQAVYPGSRNVPRWVASVHLGRTCADLTGPPFPDGVALASSASREVQINRVPAGTPLAAVIRAERFAFGCRNLAGLRAGSNTISEIEVVDRPLQMAALDLRLSFSLEQAPTLNPALDELAFRAVGPLLGTASDDLAAVLDAMSSLATDSIAFEQARTERNWRGVLVDALGGSVSGSGLRSALDGWMSTGLGELSEPDAIVGTLEAPDGDGQAPFVLSAVAGLPPAEAGFTQQNVAAVTTDTGDLLRVATTLSWQPTPLLAALAERVAIGETGASSVPDALARQLDCANVAELLVDAGNSPGEAFPDCDDNCMLSLCDAAMEVLWSRVTSSPLPAVPWEISGASRAEIDADARPTSVSGNWVGSLNLSGTGDAPVQGPFAGAVPD
jgi:hypothetical protein